MYSREFDYDGAVCAGSDHAYIVITSSDLLPARVILSEAKRNRTFSSEIPNVATHRLILAMLGFRLRSPRVILSERSESNCIAAPSGATVESRGELRSG